MPCTGKSLRACPAPRVLLCPPFSACWPFYLLAGSGAAPTFLRHFRVVEKFSRQVVNPDDIQKTVSTLAGFGSRVAGYPGEQRRRKSAWNDDLDALGLRTPQEETLFPLQFPATSSVSNADQGAFAELAAHRLRCKHRHLSGVTPVAKSTTKNRMYPLWPTLFAPRRCPLKD